MTDILKLAEQAQQTTEETDAEMALRSIASWLGVGGFNAPTFDAKVFERKIYEGVEMAIKSHYVAAEEPEAWSIPEWSKQDDLGGRVPSDVRVALNEAHRAGVRAGMVQQASVYEDTLRTVLDAVNAYLPPNGISAQECLNRVIAAVDPWPVKGD